MSFKGILKEINESIREKDEVEKALKECGLDTDTLTEEAMEENKVCKSFMDPSRVPDFAKEIAKLVSEGMPYEEAKAKVFDETKMPSSRTKCCKLIRSKVAAYLKK